MSEYLKGNYKVSGEQSLPKPPEAPLPGSQLTFEAEALQKLGGSIAFIKKSSSFVWNGDKGKDAQGKTR